MDSKGGYESFKPLFTCPCKLLKINYKIIVFSPFVKLCLFYLNFFVYSFKMERIQWERR